MDQRKLDREFVSADFIGLTRYQRERSLILREMHRAERQLVQTKGLLERIQNELDSFATIFKSECPSDVAVRDDYMRKLRQKARQRGTRHMISQGLTLYYWSLIHRMHEDTPFFLEHVIAPEKEQPGEEAA